MNENDIRIIKLDPMRVVSVYAFSSSPEEVAYQKMYEFAKENELLVNRQLPPTFGFNNPNPSAGSPNYGYEVWLPVEINFEPKDNFSVIDFDGGLYAVMLCRGIQNIGEAWMAIAKWREGTKYLAGKHQWLEHLLSPLDVTPDQIVFDLYLPISE
jgi:effector-binding domain-containing protein